MVRLQAFQPAFCPWPSCPEHHRTSRPFSFHRHGRYSTRRGRLVQRFLCLRCRRCSSSQSFATSYYLKRPHLLAPVAAALQAGSPHRQIARSVGCAPSTVTRLSARLGRHGMLLHCHALHHLRRRCSLQESFVLDHFEVFEFSQHLPFGVATAVGSNSWFLYALDPAPHGRTGRRRFPLTQRLPRHPPRQRHGGYLGSTFRVLQQLLRHSMAHYRRETIAFPRRLNAAMERFYLTAVWRNFLKGRSERRPDPSTPAMRLGLAQEPWTWRRVLSRRLFPAREPLSPTQRLLYRRAWTTPVLASNRSHELRHAY